MGESEGRRFGKGPLPEGERLEQRATSEGGEEKLGRVSPTQGDLPWVSPQGRRKTLLFLMCWEG